jgi:hypothetical protein
VAAATISVVFAHGSGGGTGGGSTVTASPTSVNISAFSPNTGFGNVTLSTASVTQISLSAPFSTVTTGGTNWLSASLNTSVVSNVSSAILTIQASAAGLANGTYLGTVTVTPSSGSTVTITVNFTVGGGGGTGNLTASINPVTLTYSTGGSFPQQAVGLTSSSGASTYTATINNVTGGNWLLANGGTFVNGFISSGVTISAGSVASSLITGSYTGHVQIQDNVGGVLDITVNLTVNGGSSTGLSVSPTSLTFTSQAVGTTSASQSSTSEHGTLPPPPVRVDGWVRW